MYSNKTVYQAKETIIKIFTFLLYYRCCLDMNCSSRYYVRSFSLSLHKTRVAIIKILSEELDCKKTSPFSCVFQITSKHLKKVFFCMLGTLFRLIDAPHSLSQKICHPFLYHLRYFSPLSLFPANLSNQLYKFWSLLICNCVDVFC